MKNEKNLKLDEIRVESFITALNSEEQEAVRGGMDEGLGTTNVRVFC